jgi:hypothetical protein
MGRKKTMDVMRGRHKGISEMKKNRIRKTRRVIRKVGRGK